MLKINKMVEYALMSLKYIAENESGKLVSAREIGNHLQIPFDTTAKVMQLMNKKKIVKSHKGINGGYSLEMPLSEITYLKLAEIIEGKEIGKVCYTKSGELCETYKTCNIITPIQQLNNRLNQYLSNLTLEELLLTNENTDTPERKSL